MNVALLYSGQLRSWPVTRLNHEKMISGDRYFYSPGRPEGEYKQFVRDHSKSMYPEPLHDYNANKNPITQLNGTLNQWGCRFIGFYLAPTTYDCYVNIRPDIELSAPINFEDYDYPDNRIYIPSGNDHCLGVNDQMSFGSYAAMKKYFSIYTEHHKLFAKGLTFHTEFYVTENLKAQGVEVVRIPQTTQIIREWQAPVRDNLITSELPSEHWRMLQVKDKRVLDLGCGRLWTDFPTTIEYFIEQGASDVTGVEMSPSEEKWYGQHAPAAAIYTDCIDSGEKLRKYLTQFKQTGFPVQVVKMDIEGAEKLMHWIKEEDLESVEQMAIEYHDNDKKRMIEDSYQRWGFDTIEHFEFTNFNPVEQGVIYLRK